MPDIREEFEAWLRPDWSQATYVDGDGDTQYVEDWVQGAWIGWQASRAALKVELPKPEYFGDHWSGDWAYNVEDTKDALREAGIEVK